MIETRAPDAWRVARIVMAVAVAAAVVIGGGASSADESPRARQTFVPISTRRPTPVPTQVPEPPLPFGRVVYRASKVGVFETLGVVVIACRHRDPAPRGFAVELFDRFGRKITLFGPSVVPNFPPGKKLVFVTDATYFPNRNVIDIRAGHLSDGTARIISDARVVHCMAKMRFDPGAHAKTYWRGTGLYREGVGATPVPVEW